MDKKLSILLIEDDPTACKKIIDLIDESDNLALAGVTNNSEEAVKMMKDTIPDAVILDLELHKGGGSGLDFLNSIRNLTLSKTPYILVTTNNTSAVTYDSVRRLGADYIMSKHQQGYSENTAIDFLRLLAPEIKSNIFPTNEVIPGAESPAILEKRITRQIISELNLIGINQKSLGFNYLVDAILITIKEPIHNICAVIGKKHGKTESSVERAMQNAINRAWVTSSIEDLLAHYTAKISSSKGVPTITEFIFYYSNKIKSE